MLLVKTCFLLSLLFTQLRLEGMRLFLLWYQALQEHAVDECHLMYATLVQGFPVPVGIKGSALEYTMTQTPRPANDSDCKYIQLRLRLHDDGTQDLVLRDVFP